MDKFNEYARANNEEWRKDLLSKALAMEAENPGFIGPRALWTIGTIDEYLFHAFASLLDISSNIGEKDIIPTSAVMLYQKEPIPNCKLGKDKATANLVFLLSDSGLIGDPITSELYVESDKEIVATYGDNTSILNTKKELVIRGVIPTVLGITISKLYTSKPNELGLKIFNTWLESIDETVADKNTLS